MKVSKWLLYNVLVIVALILIVPLFFPGTVEISTEKEIMVSPAQVFHNVASYADRNEWDSWLEFDPEAEHAVTSQPDYVGSEYSWDGVEIKTGRMVVDSVVFGQYIKSLIYYGDDPDPATVEWFLEKIEGGTMITWEFTDNAGYPIERMMMNFFKGNMLSTYETGLENLKKYLERNPPSLSKLGNIEPGTIGPMYALVIPGKGLEEEMGLIMGELYGKLDAEINAQELEMAGAPFSHYISFDDLTGITEFLAGIPVSTPGQDGEGIIAKTYPEIEVMLAMHYGPYEDLSNSYVEMMKHFEMNNIEVLFENFEFYYTDPMLEPFITKWQTLIAFPLKK